MAGSDFTRATGALGVREDATRRAVLRALAERQPRPARWRLALVAAALVLGSVAAAAIRLAQEPEPDPQRSRAAAVRVAPAAPVMREAAPEPVAVVVPPAPKREKRPALATWRHARALRAEGRTAEALAELAALERSGDETWAPLALLESARLLAASGEEERALAAVRRFLATYPRHELGVEARDLERRLGGGGR